MSEDWFRVNVDENDIEVIHHDPPMPQCNYTYMLEDISIDLLSVNRMISEGKARYCHHCFPER